MAARQCEKIPDGEICFRIGGIPVIVSIWAAVGFAVTVWFVVGLLIKRAPSLSDAECIFASLVIAVIFYIGMIFHESAHALAVILLGEKVHWVKVLWWGVRIDASPELLRELPPRSEIFAAIVGPLANLAVAGATAIPLLWTENHFLQLTLLFSAWVNAFFGVFNLLPIYGFDGYWATEGLARAIFGETSRVAVFLRHLLAIGGIVALYFIGRPIFYP